MWTGQKQPIWYNTDPGFETNDSSYIPYQRNSNRKINNSYPNSKYQPYNSTHNNDFLNNASRSKNKFDHRNAQNYSYQQSQNAYDYNNSVQNIASVNRQYIPRFQNNDYHQSNVPQSRNFNNNRNTSNKYNNPNTQRSSPNYNASAVQLQSPYNNNIYAEMNTQSLNYNNINVQKNTQNNYYDDIYVEMNKETNTYTETKQQINTQFSNYNTNNSNTTKGNPWYSKPKTYITKKFQKEKAWPNNKPSFKPRFFNKPNLKPEVLAQKGYVMRDTLYQGSAIHSDSFLQNVGPNGGGFDEDVEGVVEHIAPKATCAGTIGLDPLTEQPVPKPKAKPRHPRAIAKLKKKEFKNPELQDKFCLNVLQRILEFVKNDKENKIMFEPGLCKQEKKRIHMLVEKLRESDSLDDFSSLQKMTDEHFKFIQDIWMHNCYELWSEYETSRRHRFSQVCLYKEAPAHVYLITPEDLNLKKGKKTDIDAKDEIDITNIKKEKDSDDIFSGEEVDMKKPIQNMSCYADDVNEEQTVQKIQRNERYDNINIGIHIKQEKDAENIFNIKKENNDEDIDDNVINYVQIKQEKNIENLSNFEDKDKFANIGDIDERNVRLVKKEVTTMKINQMLDQIVKFLKQFCCGKIFKEFRFLGPFSDEQLESINLFFNICSKDDQFECNEKNELLKLLDDNKSLHVLVDYNGKNYIKKVENAVILIDDGD